MFALIRFRSLLPNSSYCYYYYKIIFMKKYRHHHNSVCNTQISLLYISMCPNTHLFKLDWLLYVHIILDCVVFGCCSYTVCSSIPCSRALLSNIQELAAAYSLSPYAGKGIVYDLCKDVHALSSLHPTAHPYQ